MPCLLKLELLKVIDLLLGTVGQKMTIDCHGVEVALEYRPVRVLQSLRLARASRPATPQPPSFCLHFPIHRDLENKMLEAAKDHVIL